MTLLLSAVAVPINTAFGIQAALFLARNEFRGKTFLISLLDLPFSISPVITGAPAGARWGQLGRTCLDSRPPSVFVVANTMVAAQMLR
jgi:sulfate transport system permease protein